MLLENFTFSKVDMILDIVLRLHNISTRQSCQKRIFGGKSEQRLQICIGLMRLQLGKPFLEIPSGTRGPDLSMTTAVSHLDASDLQKFLLPITLRALL